MVASRALSPVGSVSVGKAGEERQIHNVAAGKISADSTDAVNGSNCTRSKRFTNSNQQPHTRSN